jgi:hypothetical protein
MLPATDYSTLHRVLVLIGAVAVLASVIGNLAYARRNVTLNIELVAAANKLQEVNATQQQVNAIAQDLISFAPRFPWLVPYLQKYGLVHVQQGPSSAPGAASKGVP